MGEREHGEDLSTVHLVNAAQSGDREALECLFDRYLPRVRLIVRARMGSTAGRMDDLEDLVQESLLKVLNSIDQFQVRSEGTFCNWVAQCVQSTITDSHRRATAKKRNPGMSRKYSENPLDNLMTLLVPGEGPSPSSILRGKELEEKIVGALMDLPEHYREVIVLRQLCGMSFAEIGAVMGFEKEPSVRRVLSRALAKLKDLIAD